MMSIHFDAMEYLAPAKINLHLRVGPRRNDGFHSLFSWMVTTGLFDTLRLTTETPADGTSAGWAMSCNRKDLPTDGSNLVLRAAMALRQAAIDQGVDPSQLPMGHIQLRKRIPVGAGLGGGSSNAAFTLMALNRRWKLDWPVDQLNVIAATLGSDLSFFFHQPSAQCTGRGEVVTPLPSPRARGVLLVLPTLSMPTPPVYREFDRLGLGRDEDLLAPADLASWMNLPADQLMPRLVNDLEQPAFSIKPELGQLQNDLEQSLGRIVRMSGSGSSLFSLFDSLEQTRAAAGSLSPDKRFSVTSVPLAPPPQDLVPRDLFDQE